MERGHCSRETAWLVGARMGCQEQKVWVMGATGESPGWHGAALGTVTAEAGVGLASQTSDGWTQANLLEPQM